MVSPVVEPPTWAITLSSSTRRVANCLALAASPPEVVDHDLNLLAEHAALGVDLVGQHFEGLGFGIAEERGRASDGKHRTDLDLVLGQCRAVHRE